MLTTNSWQLPHREENPILVHCFSCLWTFFMRAYGNRCFRVFDATPVGRLLQTSHYPEKKQFALFSSVFVCQDIGDPPAGGFGRQSASSVILFPRIE
jgi:hypothetical protein